MIELIQQRFECLANFGVIDQPSKFRIAFASDGDFNHEAVAMKAATFVRGRQIWQEMSGFELKPFAEFHFHCFKIAFPNQSMSPDLRGEVGHRGASGAADFAFGRLDKCA